MNKAYEYATKVLDGTIVAPSQVKQACRNFINAFDVKQHEADYKYFWCEKTEKKVIKILNNLNFARGALDGKNIGENLALWQWFFILPIFCWQWKEFPGKRQIREVIMTVSRKNSKTVLAALIHIIAFYTDQKNAKHYLASNTKIQADNIFDELTDIIKASPYVAEHFRVLKTYVEFLPKNGVLKSLSGDSKRQDGTMVFVGCVDECGADNRIADMVGSLEGGQFGPRSPLIVKISTSYPIENAYNYWETVVDKLVKNTFAEEPNPRIFGLAYLIDDPKEKIVVDGKEIERWESQETWLESNPLIAEVPSLWDELIESYKTTKDVPKDFMRFKVKNLNIWLQSKNENEQYFMDLETLQEFEYPEANSWEWWQNKRHVMIGLDVSMSKDNTSATFLWCDVNNEIGNGAGVIYIKNKVFYPKSEEASKVQSEGLEYDKWSASEYDYCQPFGEEVVDWEGLGPELHRIIEDYNIGVATLLFDQKYAKPITKYFDENVYMEMEPHRVDQNSAQLGPVISELQYEIYRGNFRYASNKLFEASCVNAVIHYPMGKPYIKKPEYGKHTNKVDSVFSTLNAYKGHQMYVMENLYTAVDNIVG